MIVAARLAGFSGATETPAVAADHALASACSIREDAGTKDSAAPTCRVIRRFPTLPAGWTDRARLLLIWAFISAPIHRHTEPTPRVWAAPEELQQWGERDKRAVETGMGIPAADRRSAASRPNKPVAVRRNHPRFHRKGSKMEHVDHTRGAGSVNTVVPLAFQIASDRESGPRGYSDAGGFRLRSSTSAIRPDRSSSTVNSRTISVGRPRATARRNCKAPNWPPL